MIPSTASVEDVTVEDAGTTDDGLSQKFTYHASLWELPLWIRMEIKPTPPSPTISSGHSTLTTAFRTDFRRRYLDPGTLSLSDAKSLEVIELLKKIKRKRGY